MTGPVELTTEIQDCGCDYIIKLNVTQCDYFRGKKTRIFQGFGVIR